MIQVLTEGLYPRLAGLAGLATVLVACGASSSAISTSPSYEVQLAEHLTQTESVMYGAYWCPHCADQKALFKEAAGQLPYVECAADGQNSQFQLCQDKKIKGYPTWEIGGQLYAGVKSLEELSRLSHYPSPTSP
jgi:glutaredoxin